MSIDSIVHAEVGQRMTGFHSWGQWHRRNDTGDSHWPDHEVWHNQPHPNMHVQFLGIDMQDGNGSPHARMPMIPSSNFEEGVQFNGAPFTVQGAQRGEDGRIFPIPMNRFVVFRGNRISGALRRRLPRTPVPPARARPRATGTSTGAVRGGPACRACGV